MIIQSPLCSLTQANVSRQVSAAWVSSGTWRWQLGWAELWVCPFWVGCLSLQVRDATATGLGINQPGSRRGAGRWGQSSRPVPPAAAHLTLSQHVSGSPAPPHSSSEGSSEQPDPSLLTSVIPKGKRSWISRKFLENLKHYTNKELLPDSI